MTVLSREQVAEIRGTAQERGGTDFPMVGVDAVLALCDTAAWVMAGREEADRAIDAAHSELDYLIEQIPGATVSTSEESELGERVAELCHEVVEPLVAELDTLRAIVRDLANQDEPVEEAVWDPSSGYDDDSRCLGCGDGKPQRIRAGFVHAEDCVWLRARAIYGPQEETRG